MDHLKLHKARLEEGPQHRSDLLWETKYTLCPGRSLAFILGTFQTSSDFDQTLLKPVKGRNKPTRQIFWFSITLGDRQGALAGWLSMVHPQNPVKCLTRFLPEAQAKVTRRLSWGELCFSILNAPHQNSVKVTNTATGLSPQSGSPKVEQD